MMGDEVPASLFSRILAGEIPEDLGDAGAEDFSSFTTETPSEIWQSHDGRQITFH